MSLVHKDIARLHGDMALMDEDQAGPRGEMYGKQWLMPALHED
jgi:hypothetical protein